MSWLDPWAGILLALVLTLRVGWDAVLQAGAPAREERAEIAPPVAARHANRVPTWLLGALVVLTLGPRLFELLT